jgi:acetyltransferase
MRPTDCAGDITCLFEPDSVAIIGASREQGKIGHAVLANILSGGYKGHVYPVNTSGGQIAGLKVYPTILDVPNEIDVASIIVPAKFVFDIVKQCAVKRVKYAIVITSGFSEIGNVAEEQRIASYAIEHGMRILGPNVFGIYSSAANLNATFVDGNIPSGHLAMITQSGALGLTMVGQAVVDNIGLSAVVSVGNKSDVDESDLMRYLIQHKSTQVILLYIEGIRNGEKFINVLRDATRVKPVVIIKSGRSRRGAMAAASHTGSLAGSDEVFDDIARQCGAMRAESTRDAFVWSKFLADNPLPAGENTVIITNGGGAGVIASDACEKYGIRLYDNMEHLKDIFSPIIPAFGSSRNPIDMTGQALETDYTHAFDVALKDDDIHAAIGIYCETGFFTADSLHAVVDENYYKFKQAGKPLVFTLLGGEKTSIYEQAARRRSIPVSDDLYETVSSLGAMYAYKHYISEPSEEDIHIDLDTKAIDQICREVILEGRSFLFTHEAQKIMDIAGIRTPGTIRAPSIPTAVEAAKKIGYPVVMKIVSKDILHKSDVGGIALNLENEKEVIDAYGAILQNCRAAVPNASLEGVTISEMVLPGTEMIVGARRDKIFGPIVMVGLGGIYVEVMKDVMFRAYPAPRREILSMIEQIRSYPILLGVRGERTRDIDTIINVIVKVGAVILKCPVISDIEINPLVVYDQGDGAKAVDVRIILSKES